MKTLKTLKTLVAALLIFTCLSVCFALGNELLRSIGHAKAGIEKHKTYLSEVGR